MVVGILNSYNRFGAFAISPFFWNVAIIAVLVALAPLFHGDDKIYAYAIGVLVGTAIQLAIPAWDLRHTPFRLLRVFDWRSLDVRRVLLLMLPVTISLGLINFNLLINSIFGSLVSEHAPAGDRQGLQDLHAAPGDLLGRGDDGDVPDSRAPRRPPGVRGPAGDDGERDAPDRAPARPRGGGDPRALGADGPARLPARRVRRRRHRRGRDGAVLVRVLAALQRALPAPHTDVLQPPAALGADRDLRRQPGDHRRRRPGALLAVRRRRDRRRHRDRDRGQRPRPDDRAAPPARPPRAGQADSTPRRGSRSRRRRWPAASYGVWYALDHGSRPGHSARRSCPSAPALVAGGLVYRVAITALRIPEARQIWRR